MAATSRSGIVRLWDLDGRHQFDLPRQHGRSLAQFSDDGRRITIASRHLMQLFTTDADELEALATRRLTRDFTAVERERFADVLPRYPGP